MLNRAHLFALCRITALVLIFVLLAGAQSPTQDWTVVKSVAAGTEVRVALSARRIRGKVQSTSDDSLSIVSGKGQEMLARQEIVQVSVRGRGHRGRNALIGLAAGAGAGAIGAAAANSGCKSVCLSPVSKGEAVGILAGAGGLIGAAIGAALPSGGWREVYRR